MASNSTTVVIGTNWVKIGDNTNSWYLQNEGTAKVYLKISTGAPTSKGGSVEVAPTQTMNSAIMTGEVWASTVSGSTRCALVTGIVVGGGSGGGGSSVDRELVVTTYTCKTAFTGASVGDTITQTQVIDVTSTPSTVSVVWRNQTTGVDLAVAPSSANLTLAGVGVGLTDAQLRASAINVNVGNEVEIKNESGAVKQHVNGVTPLNAADYYSFSLASGDFMNFSRSSNGEQYTEVSMNPLSAGDEQSIIEYKTPFQFPCYAEVEASMSQRTKGDYAVLEITDKDDTYIDSPIEYSILASYVNNFGTTVTTGQTTTTLTMVLDSAFDGYLGSWVDIYGFLDTRFNYTNLCVASISTDKRTLTFTVADEATIPSLTATPASVVGAKLKRQAKLLLAGNALGMRFSGSSATAASYLSRFGAGSIKESGTMTGSKAVGSGSSAVVYTTGGNGQVELKAATRYRIDADPEVVAFGDRPSNSTSGLSIRSQFTSAKPVRGADYYVRFRAISPISISRPIAKIVSITKSGTTTATVTTDVPHGLTTTSYVQIIGVRDQASASFPNLTSQTVVSSVIDATKFTIVIGTASTVSSYGGAVILCNGQVTQQGLIPQAIQSVARNADGLVTLVGSATWSGFGGVGEYVNVYGVRNSGGLDLGVDGVYKVHNASTTTLILEPVKDLAGNLVYNGNAQPVTPVGAVINTTNAGGCVILRTTLRSHDMILATYSQAQIKITGQGTLRGDLALPVIPVGTTTTAEGGLITPSVGALTTTATTNATSLKTTAGTVYLVNFTNTSASTVYLKLYNKTSAPTVGTDVPLVTIPITANSFYTAELGRVGLRFSTGIAFAITGAIATADTTAITAGSLLTISYI